MTTKITAKEYTRRGITFTKADPIQNVIEELLQSYGNALDLTSVVKIALIEHWKHQTTGVVRNATKNEAQIIDESENDETLEYSVGKSELAKLGLKI